MALSVQPYKGTRDFYPEDMRLRKCVFNRWRVVCERFGYEEYDGPVLEPLELYTTKTSEEIVNEQTYSFTDRGGRQVVLRPEMTPTVSRMVAARRQELAYPLRLYSIPNFFRYERPQRGRLREFWQLNADLFGVEGIEADVEIIALADALMKAFGATSEQYSIRLNSRKAMEELLEAKGFKKELAPQIINAFDWSDKPDFEERLKKKFDDQTKTSVLQFIKTTSNEEILKTPAGTNLSAVLNKLEELGLKVQPDLTINRGFDYYTDIVFEVFDTNPENNRSMFGGGRYDGLVTEFGVEPVPTVGFGMGDVTFMNFLQSNNLLPMDINTETNLYMVLIGDVTSEGNLLATKLRDAGLNVAVDTSGRKPDKQLKTASKKGIPWVLFIGEEEIKTSQYKLKHLDSGQESKVSAAEIAKFIKTA